MPLTEGDVLDTLSDPVTLGIEFYVDKIHIKGEYLTTVRDHIRAGNILVKGGTKDLAFYDQTTDVLLTQKKSPPANDSDRALLLHECVHAMIDVYDPDGTVTRHMGELAAYLTQTTYSVRKNPSANRNGTAPGTSSGATCSPRCAPTGSTPARATASRSRRRRSKICAGNSLPCPL